MPGPLLAIDGPFVLYRSFFALPDSIRGAADRPVNALLGAVNLILRIAADKDPRAVVVCFGAEAARYRVELYPGYHAQRPPVPDDLQWQFDQAPELFEAFGWSCMTDPGLEADDLLGALAAAEAQAGGQGLIMTGDRDMYQCAADRVSVVFLKQGASGFEEVEPGRGQGPLRHHRPSWCPTSSLCGEIPPTVCPAPPASAPRPQPRSSSAMAPWRERSPPPHEERPRIAAALTDNADQLRAFRDIATLRPPDLDPPPDRPTDLDSRARRRRADTA